ncbi:MAG TPA: response regulator transcription factor [Herpetosiphonaceae bacterium]|nr:response regulator transcription factor [Herpetosiphonaceae bacterium]
MHSCHTLTKREREVLALVAQGKRNRQIAEALTITEGTVEVHLHNIFGKLDVSTRTQAALFYTFSIGLGQAAPDARSMAGGTVERPRTELTQRRARAKAAA